MTYHLRDLYLVSYVGGTAGTFITSPIWLFLVDDELPSLSKYGETEYTSFARNYTDIDCDHHGGYKINKPIYDCIPFVIRAHDEVDVGWLNEHYPENIIFNIIHDRRTETRLYANTLCKIIWRMYDNKQQQLYPTWMDLLHHVGLQPHLIGLPPRSPSELTIEQNKILITHLRDIIMLGRGFRQMKLINRKLDAKNIVNLSYWDIIYNKDKILDILSKGLNRSITDKIEKAYDDYLKAQDDFLSEIAPWILEEESEHIISDKIIEPTELYLNTLTNVLQP